MKGSFLGRERIYARNETSLSRAGQGERRGTQTDEYRDSCITRWFACLASIPVIVALFDKTYFISRSTWGYAFGYV